jgi:transcriptional regulator with XRE-family HTH domain
MGGPAEREFGRLLRQLRLARGMTQQQLADASGCDRGYVGLLERGINSPSLNMLFRLAVALDLRPSRLLVEVEAAVEAEIRLPAEAPLDAAST